MKIYRYEKEDGGGPFCTKEGILRTSPDVIFKDKILYGCISLNSLHEYFKDMQEIIQDCSVKTYEVDIKDILKINDREIIFKMKESK